MCQMNKPDLNKTHYLILLSLFFAGLIWSGIHPYNAWPWFGEVVPNLVGITILIITFPKFRFTIFTYTIILIAFWFLFVGAHYTFSRVPYIKEIGSLFGFERNNFDKLGHFIQGVVPVLIARELFTRKKLVQQNWIEFLAFCICLSTTAVYEIVEFLTCIIAGKQLENFTGAQGYIWDSQTDMLAAVIGGLFTIFFLKKAHNRAIKRENLSDLT
jgi:putative membrane protein